MLTKGRFMKEFNTFFEVALHNTDSLESQMLLVTDDQNKAEDLYCDINRILSRPMAVTICQKTEKNHQEDDVF